MTTLSASLPTRYNRPMIILGLDPGLGRTGFGLISQSRGNIPVFLRAGCLTTPASLSTEDRLTALGNDLATLIADTHPDHAAVEQVFFGANAKTAMATAQARGVLIYVLRQHNIPVETLTPLQIKSRLSGYGAADKHQVQHLVRQRLGLTTVPQPDDAADALAAALSL